MGYCLQNGPVIEAAIDEPQKGFLDEDRIRCSRAIMGVDTQLLDDATYFVVELDGQVIGCGGWSVAPPGTAATTGWGGTGRCSTRPPTRPGSGRWTMYTRPAFTRRGRAG